MVSRLDAFHKTAPGYAIFGLAELAFGYIFLLWSIDSGSLLDWFLTLLLISGGLRNMTRLVVRLVRRQV